MDTVKSFKGYGKVNPVEDREFRRTTRKRVVIIVVSIVLLLVIVVGSVIGVVVSRKIGDSDENTSSSPTTSSVSSIKAVCSVTRYPDSCFSSISSVEGSNATSDPEELFKLSLRVAADGLSKASAIPEMLAKGVDDKRVVAALQICKEMLDDAADSLNSSLDLMKPTNGEKLLTGSKVDDLKTWLSAAITNQETCLDGFDNTTGGFREKMKAAISNTTQLTSNSLAIVSGVFGLLDKLNIPIHRKLLATDPTGLPAWLSAPHRRALLQSSNSFHPNVTVARDGTGQFQTIMEAVALVPPMNSIPFVIYIKEGTYVEKVLVDKKKWNVVMIGDGKDKTVITGWSNNVQGTPTFLTATVGVDGKGFMARDIGFKNTAGAEGHQAVAFRSKSDHSVYYRCAFDAYQDTLYAHSFRQFYRECDIIGTIDFIFGNAAQVLQNCNIMPREPLPNQKNTITAQGKTDPNENSGISIQGCTISPYGQVTAPTYLGRPWKGYSTTVVMKSEIGAMVDAEGWLAWEAGTAPPNTIFYAEYQNTGPGSSTAGRVKWPGHKPTLTDEEAANYGVDKFIEGDEWIGNTGVTFD